jgi:hypothetical protein
MGMKRASGSADTATTGDMTDYCFLGCFPHAAHRHRYIVRRSDRLGYIDYHYTIYLGSLRQVFQCPGVLLRSRAA